MQVNAAGQVELKLKTPWRDGTTHLVMSPLEFMQVQRAGEMPSLPAQNSALRSALMTDKVCLDRLMEVSDRLGAWTRAAQDEPNLNPKLPPEVILYSLLARACEPVFGLLKVSGNHGDEQVIEKLVSSCFDGLVGANGRPGARYLDRSQARH